MIISASGMAESGRILHHLKNNIEDPKNTIMIVGWQAPNTLGRRLVEKQRRVKIFGEDYDLKAQVVTMNGLSAHADRSELIEWAGHLQPAPRQTFLVHGEPDSAFALADGLQQSAWFCRTCTCRNSAKPLRYNTQLLAHARECLQGDFNVAGCMCGRIHDANTGLALGNGGVANGHGKDSFLKQSAAKCLSQRRFAQHHRHDRRL